MAKKYQGWAYVSGSADEGADGPTGAVQYLHYGTIQTGSSNFVYVTGSDALYFTGSIYVSGTVVSHNNANQAFEIWHCDPGTNNKVFTLTSASAGNSTLQMAGTISGSSDLSVGNNLFVYNNSAQLWGGLDLNSVGISAAGPIDGVSTLSASSGFVLTAGNAGIRTTSPLRLRRSYKS